MIGDRDEVAQRELNRKCPHGFPLHDGGPAFIHEPRPHEYQICRKAERDAKFLAEKTEHQI